MKLKTAAYIFFYVKGQISILEIDLCKIISEDLFKHFLCTQTQYNKAYIKLLDESHNRKLNNLIHNNFDEKTGISDDNLTMNTNNFKSKWFKNLTQVNIPNDVIEVASLSPKFNANSKLQRNQRSLKLLRTPNIH